MQSPQQCVPSPITRLCHQSVCCSFAAAAVLVLFLLVPRCSNRGALSTAAEVACVAVRLQVWDSCPDHQATRYVGRLPYQSVPTTYAGDPLHVRARTPPYSIMYAPSVPRSPACAFSAAAISRYSLAGGCTSDVQSLSPGAAQKQPSPFGYERSLELSAHDCSCHQNTRSHAAGSTSRTHATCNVQYSAFPNGHRSLCAHATEYPLCLRTLNS